MYFVLHKSWRNLVGFQFKGVKVVNMDVRLIFICFGHYNLHVAELKKKKNMQDFLVYFFLHNYPLKHFFNDLIIIILIIICAYLKKDKIVLQHHLH